jgi:hypothetical protein
MGLAIMVATALECGRSARCGNGSAQKLSFRDGVTGPRCFSIGGQLFAPSLKERLVSMNRNVSPDLGHDLCHDVRILKYPSP